jgi:hypothetical protein
MRQLSFSLAISAALAFSATAGDMLRNRRVIGARSQVRKVRVRLGQELAPVAERSQSPSPLR